MSENRESKSPSVSHDASLDPALRESALPGISRTAEQLLDLRRIGIVMSPDADRPEEAWGVLNPASARSRDGELFLFPRVVATGNYSRIGMARVIFDASGNPASAERLGFVLEPRESYEYVSPGVGGVEDPRITFVPLLDTYVMSYTAFGPQGARVALAVSRDLYSWERLGLLQFEALGDFHLDRCDNKDCVIFPIPVTAPSGVPAIAVLHRPMYPATTEDGATRWILPAGVTDPRPSIWISYVPVERARQDVSQLAHVGQHHVLAQPIGDWEHHHIGAGAPPILSEEGWMLYYHGVVGERSSGDGTATEGMVYRSGVMLLDRSDPRRILFRSFKPVLSPREASEQQGIVSDVVFPTAVDVRSERIDVYYGAADQRIAAATTRVSSSELLAPSAPPSSLAPQHLAVPGGRLGEAGRPTDSHRLFDRDLVMRGIISVDDVARSAENPMLAGETLQQTVARSDQMRGTYKRILVALDGSSLAERVLSSTIPLAQKFESTVTLLRAVTPARVPEAAAVGIGSVPEAGLPDPVGPAEDARRSSEEYLEDMASRLEREGLKVETECIDGPPSEVILRRARQLKVDLIAITTHGRTGVDRLMLGSVAEDVIRRTPCPVHLVRVRGGN